MNDTSKSIEIKMAQMMGLKSPSDRLKMAGSMFDAGKKLMIAGLLHEKGPLDEARLRAQLFVKLYGDCFTRAEVERILNKMPKMQLETES